MDASADQTMGVPDTTAMAASDSSPRQPQSKVQKLEAKTQEEGLPVAHELTATNGKINGGLETKQHEVALRVKKLSPHATIPSRGSRFAAGYDLSSAYDYKVPARGKVLANTDLSIAIPEGTYARIAPRSGLALKNSIAIGAGVVDYDYRGNVGVILFNHSDVDFEVKAGDRIAQLILERILTPDVIEVGTLECTERGGDGFGSTGLTGQAAE